ncbi:MAG: uracil phosphoribosyltransferase [Solobacterium sp.]|nr:uracil phosphoribosyltransferase [Solobacterium sp.]
MTMLEVLNHPLITHKLTLMRKKETGTKDFRESLDEIAELMAYEVCRELPTKPVEIETPIAKCVGQELSKEVVIVPILRAGIGLLDGIRRLVPTAKVGFIGLFRDEETLQPHEYFAKFPKNLEDSVVMIVDPMLATGGSAVAAIDMVKKRGAKDIKMVCLVGVPEGVKAIQDAHPDVDIYLAAMDEKLNEIGYIVPGLGDAGDRIFGTK